MFYINISRDKKILKDIVMCNVMLAEAAAHQPGTAERRVPCEKGEPLPASLRARVTQADAGRAPTHY